MTALNYMTQVPLDVTALRAPGPGDNRVTVACTIPRNRSLSSSGPNSAHADGDEILPIEYNANYGPCSLARTVELAGRPGPANPPMGEGDGLQHPPQVVAIQRSTRVARRLSQRRRS